MNKKILIVSIIALVTILGINGYIYWTNKDAEVTQKPDVVQVNDIIDDKVATSTETANSDNKTVDETTAEALKAEKFFTDCLKVMFNINDISNAEEMKPVREFMAQNVRQDYIDVMEKNYTGSKTFILKDFKIKEVKKGNFPSGIDNTNFDGYSIIYDYKLEIDGSPYEKTDAEAIIAQKNENFILGQFETKK